MQNYLDFADAIRSPARPGLARRAPAGMRTWTPGTSAKSPPASCTESGHEGRAYELTGREAYSFDDVARRIGTISGREVRFVDLSPEEGRRALITAGESEWSADAWIELLAWFQDGEGTTNGSAVSPGVEEVLDRPPRPLDAFLRENIRAFGE